MTAYSGAHRDNTPAALTECGRRDQATADHRAICAYPCAHHQPRHSPVHTKEQAMNKRTATVARVRIVATRMGHAADLYDTTAAQVSADCPDIAELLEHTALRFRAFQRELMGDIAPVNDDGDIGEPRREYQAEPIEQPVEVPTTEPAPLEPVPA